MDRFIYRVFRFATTGKEQKALNSKEFRAFARSFKPPPAGGQVGCREEAAIELPATVS